MPGSSQHTVSLLIFITFGVWRSAGIFRIQEISQTDLLQQWPPVTTLEFRELFRVIYSFTNIKADSTAG